MEEEKQLTKVSVEELAEAIDLMQRINAISETTYIRYLGMVDFIKSKGLTDEWEDYLRDILSKKQDPAIN